MIKSRLLFAAIAVLFTFFLVVLTAFRISQSSISDDSSFKLSQLDNNKNINYFIEATTSSEKIFFDYNLPYPGILPNHPLYWVKMLRDKIKLIFIKDKIDLFYLYLQNADKRLISGLILIKQDQKDLAVTTLTKSEKYLFKASTLLVEEIDEKENSHLYHQMAKSYLKHDQLIKSNLDNFSDKQKQILENSLDNNQTYFQNHFINYLNVINCPPKESSTSAVFIK